MQLDLFRKPRRPAKRNPRTMGVVDAGTPGAGGRAYVRFECAVCGHETDWLRGRSVTAEMKGRVCPVCQGDPANVKPSCASSDEGNPS
ncbi:hypothetical protein VY88_26410 [Azospirillum thiophilum]|uniref:Uncharacterized protein n=1 Tax=Azospirillum thiophilum TaxID=528244 RepID=A0AAC9EYK7_9PROT|nr:hypothetical protein [Azospirillum thiophilum]ALG75067.1 hypothetical protein AL072_29320 [Azospirillum thiophilum]KJR62460.1 hypothetical protein VY88_26410 [Azospirillum thiophilum]